VRRDSRIAFTGSQCMDTLHVASGSCKFGLFDPGIKTFLVSAFSWRDLERL